MVLVLFGMILVLYIAIIAVIIFIAMPKSKVSVDGNWGMWSLWSSCDVTCGRGLQTRFRTSSSPSLATGGLPCSGSPTDFAVCGASDCTEQNILSTDNHVSFSAKLFGKTLRVGPNQRVVFNKVLNNNMNGYDNSSGIFEAPLSGVYLFVFFIEIDSEYGATELRVNKKVISFATAYGMSVRVSISGINNTVAFESTKSEEIFDNIKCLGGQFSISGIRNTVKVIPDLDSCPYNKRAIATGGNSAVTYVRAGEKVWIQADKNTTLYMRPEGTTFTGILLH